MLASIIDVRDLQMCVGKLQLPASPTFFTHNATAAENLHGISDCVVACVGERSSSMSTRFITSCPRSRAAVIVRRNVIKTLATDECRMSAEAACHQCADEQYRN